MCWHPFKQRLYSLILFKGLKRLKNMKDLTKFNCVKTLINFIALKHLGKFLQTFDIRIS